MPEQLTAAEGAIHQAPIPQENPWEARLRRQGELINTLNSLEGQELEEGLANHYQSVVDEALAGGGDTSDVEAALHMERFSLAMSGSDLRKTLSEDPSYRQSPRADFLGRVNDFTVHKAVMDKNK